MGTDVMFKLQQGASLEWGTNALGGRATVKDQCIGHYHGNKGTMRNFDMLALMQCLRMCFFQSPGKKYFVQDEVLEEERARQPDFVLITISATFSSACTVVSAAS